MNHLLEDMNLTLLRRAPTVRRLFFSQFGNRYPHNGCNGLDLEKILLTKTQPAFFINYLHHAHQFLINWQWYHDH